MEMYPTTSRPFKRVYELSGEWVSSDTRRRLGHSTRQSKRMEWLSTDKWLNMATKDSETLSGPRIPHSSWCSEPRLTVTSAPPKHANVLVRDPEPLLLTLKNHKNSNMGEAERIKMIFDYSANEFDARKCDESKANDAGYES